MTASLTIDEKNAEKFKILTVAGNKRSYTTLRPGWTDALHDLIVEETNTQCVFQFKRISVVGEEFVTHAQCSECLGSITATSFGERKNVSVEFVYGEGTHTFQKQRRLTTSKAKSLISALKADTVFNVHSDLVNEIDTESEFLPRNYVSQKSLSNVKHRYINNQSNSINALRDLKYGDYCDVIKEIGTDPFFALFWTSTQKYVYSQIAKRGRTVISIDATGGLVSNHGLLIGLAKRVQLPHIFLYLICLKKQDGSSIPIAQLLSAQQDTKKIKYFLERFQEDFGTPNEVNLDEGKALQKACAKVFADCKDIAEYTKKCFAILNNCATNSSIDRGLECFIRQDVSHFVFNLHKSKVFDKAGNQAKHFYKCIIGAIVQIPSYDEIKIIVRDMLILANYPIEGVLDDGIEAPTAQSRIRLQRLIRTHDTSFISTESETTEDEIFLSESNKNVEDNSDTSDITWYLEMLDEIKKSANTFDTSPNNLSSNISMNNYQCTELNAYLQDLLLRLPLWGCVMCAYFKSPNLTGNSCNVERQFGLIKSNIFKKYTLPVSATVFVQTMVNRINSVATLTKLIMKHTNNQNKADIEDDFDPEPAQNVDLKTHEVPNVR